MWNGLFMVLMQKTCVDFVAPNNEHEEQLDKERETTISEQ